MTKQLGSQNNLRLEIKPTEPTAGVIPDSYGRIEGTVLINGFNTKYGSCVPTGVLNYIRATYMRAGRTDTITDALALQLYTAVTGFNPDDPATDQGTNPEDMLAYFKNNKIAGATLKDFVRIDHTDEYALRNAIIKTGGVLLIFELSRDQESQKEWEPTNDSSGTPGTWGGHCVMSPSYSGAEYFVITWGEIGGADRAFLNANGYLVGAYELDIALDPEVILVKPAFDKSNPQTVLACTIWMEDAIDGDLGMQAVASVVLNRANNPSWWGHDILSVCLAPWQFSSWNFGSPLIANVENAIKQNVVSYQRAYEIAGEAIAGTLKDNTKGSDSYYAISLPKPPTWATEDKFKVQIGRQRYYKIQ